MDDLAHKELVIEPGKRNDRFWSDIWDYREMLYILSWRDFKVRYKQTLIGASWSVIRPLLTTLIFTFVFNRVAKVDNLGTTPYALVVFTGTLAWQFFSTALQDVSGSLLGNAALISKVYFPRIIVPASSLITALIDFLITFALLVIALFFFGIFPSFRIIALPFFLIIALLAAFGLGSLFSALMVRYRDLRFVIPFIVQFGLFISPVGYRSSIIEKEYQYLFALNPMTGVIDGFRWALLNEPLSMANVLIGSSVSLLLFIIGIGYFRRSEMRLIDSL